MKLCESGTSKGEQMDGEEKLVLSGFGLYQGERGIRPRANNIDKTLKDDCFQVRHSGSFRILVPFLVAH